MRTKILTVVALMVFFLLGIRAGFYISSRSSNIAFEAAEAQVNFNALLELEKLENALSRECVSLAQQVVDVGILMRKNLIKEFLDSSVETNAKAEVVGYMEARYDGRIDDLKNHHVDWTTKTIETECSDR